MADTLVERVTGQATAEGGTAEIELVMTDAALLGGEDTPAHVVGYGPIPAALARQIVRDADQAWLRRLFTRPDTGMLVAMDSRRREFDGELRHFLLVRDEICWTPWCDAPVRHADHVVRVADGGATGAGNGQGLCAVCNYAKEAAGWKARRIDGRQHRVAITTPTGHNYISAAPDPPVRKLAHLFPATPSTLEQRLRRLTSA